MTDNDGLQVKYEQLLDENYKLRRQLALSEAYESVSNYLPTNNMEQCDIKLKCQRREIRRLVKQVNELKDSKYVDKLTVAIHDLCLNDDLEQLYPNYKDIVNKFSHREPNPYRYITLNDTPELVDYKRKVLLDRLDSLPDFIVNRFETKNMTDVIKLSQRHLRQKYLFDIDLPETDKSIVRHWWHLPI